ncbi:MAG: DUF1467 family protein [Croceibacterium sp.]
MRWTSVLAIYSLFWVLSAFMLLPFGIKTHDEAGIAKIPGQADSAPANFQPRKLVIRATIVAAVLCTLYVTNYVEGWVVADDLNLYRSIDPYRDN